MEVQKNICQMAIYTEYEIKKLLSLYSVSYFNLKVKFSSKTISDVPAQKLSEISDTTDTVRM